MNRHLFLAAVCSVFVVTATMVIGEDAAKKPATDDQTKGILTLLAGSPGERTFLGKLRAIITTTADAKEKGRLKVIYCLGCLYTGQGKNASEVRADLIQNHPDTLELKYLSSKYLGEPCTACEKTGKVTTDCIPCKGTGKCSFCGGRGKRTLEKIGGGTKTVTCPKCAKGVCYECKGSGEASAKRCPACRGAGIRPSRKKLKAVYLTLLKGEKP